MDLWDFPHTSVAKQTSAELFKILPMTDFPPSYLPTPTPTIPASAEFKRRNTVTALQRRPSLSSKEIEETITHIATNQSEECKKSWYIIQQLVEEVKHRELYNKELEMRNKQLVRQKSATGQTFENMRRQSVSQPCKKNHRSTSLAEFVASPRARKYSCLDINAHVVVPMDLVQEMLTCETEEKHQRKANQEPSHYEGELRQDMQEEEEEEELEEESNSLGEASCDLREQLNNYVFPLKDVVDDETPEQSYYSSCEISVRDYDEAEEEADEYPEEAQDEEQAEEEEQAEVYEQCEDDEEVEQQDARYRSFVDSLNVDDFEPYISDDEES